MKRRTMSRDLVAFVREARRTRSEVQRRFWPDSAANGMVLALLCELDLVDDDGYARTEVELYKRVRQLEAEIATLRRGGSP